METQQKTTYAQPLERGIAVATVAAPTVLTIAAPLLNGGAGAFVTALSFGWLGLAGGAFGDFIPKARVLDLPLGDIVYAHREPMFAASMATVAGAGLGAAFGPGATDILMAGFFDLASINGIMSAAWWGLTGYTALKLRKVVAKPKKTKADAPMSTEGILPTAICQAWGLYISGPGGLHPGQNLELLSDNPDRWVGRIEVAPGKDVTVRATAIASLYRVPLENVELTPGESPAQAYVTVTLNSLVPAPESAGLAGLWGGKVARKNGVAPGTHLEDVQYDRVTGGEVAYVVADEDTDSLPAAIDQRDLAGALRTQQVLVSYEPSRDPRRAVIRLMKENPLRKGQPLPSLDSLVFNKGGFFDLGLTVSGRPVRAQLLDPKLGAKHMVITGVTGSGKGGVLQLVALAAHLNGSSILYGDPKGSSNPSIEPMAAHCGTGEDGAMGTLRVLDRLIDHRVELTQQLKQKNFDSKAMPHVVFVLDEASMLLGEGAKHRAEAKVIIEKGAKLGRSIGISMVLANQILQLEQLGGSSAVRDNVVGGGSVIMLRGDSSQKSLIDLPPGMESCNPADLPASWKGEESVLVYDDSVELVDPEPTFGLGYFLTADGICSMSRSYVLEDATPYVKADRVQVPFDWPDWHLHEEIAGQASDTDEEGVEYLETPSRAKAQNAEEKILDVLMQANPLEGMAVADIATEAELSEQTVQNTLGRLVKEGQAERVSKGMYCKS